MYISYYRVQKHLFLASSHIQPRAQRPRTWFSSLEASGKSWQRLLHCPPLGCFCPSPGSEVWCKEQRHLLSYMVKQAAFQLCSLLDTPCSFTPALCLSFSVSTLTPHFPQGCPSFRPNNNMVIFLAQITTYLRLFIHSKPLHTLRALCPQRDCAFFQDLPSDTFQKVLYSLVLKVLMLD